MNNKQAADWLGQMLPVLKEGTDAYEATAMAISALDCIEVAAIRRIKGDAESATTTEVDYCNNCPYLPWGKDCISREQAIEEIKNATTITGWNKYASQEEIVDDVEGQLRRLFVGAIESLPPVTPTERTGEWVGSGDGYDWNGELVYDTWECSKCGYAIDEDDTDLLPKYCQECGAKMGGDTE